MNKEEIIKRLEFETKVFNLLNAVFSDITARAKIYEGDLAEFLESEKWNPVSKPSDIEVAASGLLNHMIDVIISSMKE